MCALHIFPVCVCVESCQSQTSPYLQEGGDDVIFPKVEMCLVTWVVGSTEVAITIISTPGPSFKSRCPLGHGLLYPHTHTRRVQQGTGTGWVYPPLAIPVPPAGGWRVGPYIRTPREKLV